MIKDFSATLTHKQHLSGKVWGFTFTLKDGETLEFVAGQYVLLKIDGNYRQYSICTSSLQNDSFDFIIEYFEGGLASTYLAALEVGQDAHFKGPAGVFTLQNSECDKVYLATGTGIAPIKSMIETQLVTLPTTKAHLYFGLRMGADMYLQKQVEELKKKFPDTFIFTYCLSRESEDVKVEGGQIYKGHIQDALEIFWKDNVCLLYTSRCV